MKPLVSIITPSFNQAAYLEMTIRSALAQDYQPIEYMIVDGGSQDDSVAIIRKYEDRLSWWVSEPDSGQAEAINKGLQRAKGEFVAWINSDDIYLPGAISQAVAALQSNPEVGLVYGDAITIDAQGKPIQQLCFGDWGLNELIRFRIICQPAVFMRRSVLKKVGFLDPGYQFLLDHHLWIRMALQAPILHLHGNDQDPPPLLAAARHHPAAKNVAQASDFGEEAMRILAWMQEEPALAAFIKGYENQIRGGASRLNARYLLDGGLPHQAFLAYVQALKLWPQFAIKHWHRMFYAGCAILSIQRGLDRLQSNRLNKQRARLVSALQASLARHNTSLDSWPGLSS